MARVAPSERFRRELDDVLAGVDGEADPVERIGRLGARLILRQALEDEVSEFLGRARYERALDPVSHRNGYEPRRVVTTAGPVELERPRVRNARQLGFESRILGRHVARAYARSRRSSARSCAGRRCATSTPRWRRPSMSDRRARLPGHAQALPAPVPASARRARPRLFVPRCAVSEAAARRGARRGRPGRLGCHARGPQRAARSR
jgi:mutator family transposase